MSKSMTFAVDGAEVKATAGQTILQAADAAGIYIPRLCNMKGLTPRGACRVCTVLVNGRPQAACTQPVADGVVVQNDTEALRRHRRNLVEMLFVEGNHFCMFCEKSGNCELQALAYRFGIVAPHYPYLFPVRDVDASHPEVMIDRNRCILCGRCVTASREIDGKTVFELIGRGPHRHLAVDAEAGLGKTPLVATDKAADVCPVGSIVKKRAGYATPVGQRKYDHLPIGSEVEAHPRQSPKKGTHHG